MRTDARRATMRRMPARGFTVRWVALVAAATVALHAIRFALHPFAGPEAHGHLRLLSAAVLALVLASGWAWLTQLRRGGDASAPRPRLAPLAAASGAIVLAAFAGQELAEALLAPHGHGLHGLTGEGAWMLPLLAGGLGLAVALLVRGAQEALVRAAAARRARFAGPAPSLPRPASAPARRRDPLARRLAGRGPPARRPVAA